MSSFYWCQLLYFLSSCDCWGSHVDFWYDVWSAFHIIASFLFYCLHLFLFYLFSFRHLMPTCLYSPPTSLSVCLILLFYSSNSSYSSCSFLVLFSTPCSCSFLTLIRTFNLSSSYDRFSRYDYQKVRNGPSPSYRSLIAALPLQVRTWSDL